METVFGMLLTSWLESLDLPDSGCNFPPGAYKVRGVPDPRCPSELRELVLSALEKASKAVEMREAGNLEIGWRMMQLRICTEGIRSNLC
jgi:hypothetical protein